MHIKTTNAQIYKPETTHEKIDPQKMFIDNIVQHEANYTELVKRDADIIAKYDEVNQSLNTYTKQSDTDVINQSLTHHLANISNPHSVTKTQVGLGSVNNTSDANKPISTPQQTALNLKLDKTGDSKDNTTTFTQAGTLANIVTGETHAVSLGKIAKAIADFITHIGRTNNPHSVTKTQVGLGNVADVLQYSASNPQLNVTGSSGSCTGNSATATKLTTAKTISLTGDVTGSVSFDGSANVSITSTVTDDSHNHIISNVDGLQTALDGKSNVSHTHATDRDRANHTGTQLASTISDFASTVRSTVLTGLSFATSTVISATDTVLSAFGKLQAQITANLSTLTTHIGRTNNPHSVTKSQVGLSNVDNTADANKPVSTAQLTALNLKVNKDSVINTTAEVSAITADNIPCGTKPVKELIKSLNETGNYDLYYTTSDSTTNQVTVDLTKYKYVALFPSVGGENSIQNIGYIPTGLFKAKGAWLQLRNDDTYAAAFYIDDNTIKLYKRNCVGANFVGIK